MSGRIIGTQVFEVDRGVFRMRVFREVYGQRHTTSIIPVDNQPLGRLLAEASVLMAELAERHDEQVTP